MQVNQGGLLGAYVPQQQASSQPMQSGGLLGAYVGMGQSQAPQAGGTPPMPPEMRQAIEQMRTADPETRQQFIQEVSAAIQSSGKPQAQLVLQQFMQAMNGGV